MSTTWREVTTLWELSFVAIGTDVVVAVVVVAAVVKAGLARSSKDSWTARGATWDDEDISTLLFSFSSSTMMTAPGTLSAILDEAWIAAFSVWGVRVTEDLTIDPSLNKHAVKNEKCLNQILTVSWVVIGSWRSLYCCKPRAVLLKWWPGVFYILPVTG